MSFSELFKLSFKTVEDVIVLMHYIRVNTHTREKSRLTEVFFWVSVVFKLEEEENVV